jgi:hypothetical protein
LDLLSKRNMVGTTRVHKNRVTLAFSPHRVEALSLAACRMRRHEAIILEEPEHPRLVSMLRKKLSIDTYLLETDVGFPRFARRSCQLLQELYAEGKEILQVDPFMDRLLEIHDLFGAGGSPEEIREGSPHHPVYRAERRCASALLDYYQKSAGPDFDEVVASTLAYAKADAARGRLRDRLRAEKLASIVGSYESVYVEAGELHVVLLPELRRRIPSTTVLLPVYLMDPAVRQFGGKRRALGPGDVLTLIYGFRPDYEGPRADLLAARNLIHIKILNKEEMEGAEGLFPHTWDQVESNRLVEGLSYPECRGLFQEIRSLATEEARQRVRAYRQRGN